MNVTIRSAIAKLNINKLILNFLFLFLNRAVKTEIFPAADITNKMLYIMISRLELFTTSDGIPLYESLKFVEFMYVMVDIVSKFMFRIDFVAN